MFMCGMCYVHMYGQTLGIFLLILMFNSVYVHVSRSTQYKYKGMGSFGDGADSSLLQELLP